MGRISTLQFPKRFKPVFFFPAVLLALLVLATLLRISGTSTGVYGYLMDSHPGQGFLEGQARTVRSDEWAVNTPFVVAQTKNNFQMNNKNIGTGQDMAVVLDVPYKDWSTAFRPQNLAFFILPVEFAFAFKWWLLAVLLLLAVYSFILQIYPSRYLLASLLSLAFFFSPFIQWWYQSITLLPIAYSLIAVSLAYNFIRTTSRRAFIAYGIALSYTLTCFALVMYPAFQIGAVLVALSLFIGILYGEKGIPSLWRKRNIAGYIGIIATVGILVGIFLLQHWSVITTIQNTVYPGARNVPSGGFNIWSQLMWPFSYLLLNGGPGTVFGNNQSEVSGFLLFGFSSMVLLFIVRSSLTQFSKLEKSLFATMGLLIVLLLIRLFVPIGSELFALVGLNKVPLIRLVLIIGILNIVCLAIVVARKDLPEKKISPWWRNKTLHVSPLILLVSCIGLWLVDRHFVIDSVGNKEIGLVALVFTIIMTLLLYNSSKVRLAGLAVVVAVSIFSTGSINPLYIGLSALNNPLTRAVEKIEKHDGAYWAADDDPTVSALLVSTGAEVVGGVNTYPQPVWKQTFPSESTITNRYAHIRLHFDKQSHPPTVSLVQSDSFSVSLSSCDELVNTLKIRYVVSSKSDALPCFRHIAIIHSGQKNLTIFEKS